MQSLSLARSTAGRGAVGQRAVKDEPVKRAVWDLVVLNASGKLPGEVRVVKLEDGNVGKFVEALRHSALSKSYAWWWW